MFKVSSIWHKLNHRVSLPDNFSEKRYMTAYPDCNGKAKWHYKKEGAKQIKGQQTIEKRNLRNQLASNEVDKQNLCGNIEQYKKQSESET